MGIRVKQFKEIDYPQSHTGKGEHNAKHKSQQNTNSRHKKNRTEEKRNWTIWEWEEEGQSKRKTCTKEHSMNKTRVEHATQTHNAQQIRKTTPADKPTKVDTPKQYTNTQSSHRDQQHKENGDAITKNKTTRHEEDIVDVPRDKNQGKNSPFNELSFRQSIILCHETQNTKHKTQNTKHKTQNTKHKRADPFLIKVLQGTSKRERRKEPTQEAPHKQHNMNNNEQQEDLN